MSAEGEPSSGVINMAKVESVKYHRNARDYTRAYVRIRMESGDEFVCIGSPGDFIQDDAE